MKKINNWNIEAGHTATFGNDDFESWWLAGMTRDDKIKKQDRSELYENCIYIAEAEQREMTQSASELKSAINDWADEWNKKINVSVAAATLGSIKSPRKAASSRENGKKGGRPCNHRAGNGRASDYDRKRYCPGDECASCGCTLGDDWHWYIDRDNAPGYPDFS